MLTENEVEEIRRGLAEGLRGPVLLKWSRQLLEDHDERVRLERERAATAVSSEPSAPWGGSS